MKSHGKPLQPTSNRRIFLFAGLLLAATLAGCACTKGYVFDGEKDKNKIGAVDFDSSYYIIGELFRESFGGKRQLLKIHGTDYTDLRKGQGLPKPLDLSESVLYWTDVKDSLRLIRAEGDVRFYAIDTASNLERGELHLLVSFKKKDAAGGAATVKHYALSKFTNCRFGLH